MGILIPPSIMLIVYAAATNVSIVRLYAGALLPGLTLVGLYLVYVIGRSILQPSAAPRPTDDEVPDVPMGKLILMIATSFVPLAFLILAVLGSILFGLATPTEAASIGALGGIFLAFVYRAMTWSRMRESVYLTARTTAMVCWLFVGSYTFSAVFSYLGGEHLISEFVQSMNLTPVQFLILAQLIIFLLGWPLEWSEIIIIFVPIFLPLSTVLRYRPAVFRHPCRVEPANQLPDASDGNVGLLSERDRATRGASDADFRRCHAVPCLRHNLDGADVSLPADRLLSARAVLWQMTYPCRRR